MCKELPTCISQKYNRRERKNIKIKKVVGNQAFFSDIKCQGLLTYLKKLFVHYDNSFIAHAQFTSLKQWGCRWSRLGAGHRDRAKKISVSVPCTTKPLRNASVAVLRWLGFKGGNSPKRHFSAAWHGFNGNISFTFQAIQKPYHYPVNLCCGVFCEFLGIFGRSSFFRRIS